MNRLLLQEERAAVDAALRFANLGHPIREPDVERCFAGLVDFDEFRPRRHAGEDNWVRFNLAPLYARIQKLVRAWLTLIVKGRRAPKRPGGPAALQAGRKKVARRVASLLARSIDHAAVTPAVKDGRLVLTCHFGNSIEAACAFGIALILDERRGLTNRLKQCRYCGRFNFAERKGRGPLPQFCNDEHARLYWNKDSKKRQAEFKKRKAKLERKQQQRGTKP
jgi:hypothetical protein